MSKRKSNAARKVEEVPAELNEFIPDDAQVEIGESEQAAEPESTGGTDQGKMVGDINPIVSAGEQPDKLFAEHKNKSGVIRYLHSKGYQTKHIAKFLNVRYQHVRNVLNTPLKRQTKTPAVPATE